MNSGDIKNKAWPQYLAALAASLGMVSGGTVIGWPSPSMKFLLSEESPIPMTYNDLAWIISTTNIGSLLSAIFCACTLDRFGRKPVLLLSSLFYIIGWLCALFANNLILLYVSRFFGGLALGTSICCTPIYNGEIVEKHRRGVIGLLLALSMSIGILIASILGSVVSFKMLNGVSMIFPILFLITFFFMPESPYFLVSKDKTDQAYTSLRWLRGQNQLKEIENEIEDIKKFTSSNRSLNFVDTIVVICSKTNRKAIVLMAIVLFGQQFSGLNGVLSYAERIFILIETSITPSNAVIILNLVPIAPIFLTIFLIDKVGRKVLLLLSLLGTAICNTVIGTYLLLSENGIIGTEYAWVAITGLYGFQIFVQLGLASVPYILLGEVFPNETKAWSNSFAIVFTALLGTAVMKLFQIFDESVGAYAAFFMFASSLFVSFIFILLFMPETKNKSFIEIQELLQNKKQNTEKDNKTTNL